MILQKQYKSTVLSVKKELRQEGFPSFYWVARTAYMKVTFLHNIFMKKYLA